MTQARSPITTHVLDLNSGKAAAQIPVTLEILSGTDHPGQHWKILAKAVTNADGRIETFLPPGSRAEPGTYRLTFDTRTANDFYPSVIVTFELNEPDRHHHIPLLLSPYGYSTYRGT